jgi:hypothetical protein
MPTPGQPTSYQPEYGEPDAVIARSLFDRAKGFSHKVTRTTLYQGEERTITNTVQYPPTPRPACSGCVTEGARVGARRRRWLRTPQ